MFVERLAGVDLRLESGRSISAAARNIDELRPVHATFQADKRRIIIEAIQIYTHIYATFRAVSGAVTNVE